MNIEIRQLVTQDLPRLQSYYDGLSGETRRHFSPHGFSIDELTRFYNDPAHVGFVALHDGVIIAYAILRMGYLPHDAERLRGYGFIMDNWIDVTFAPSVSDEWQGRGVAAMMLDHIKSDARSRGRLRIFLWGGVQASNARAVQFYRKHGFIELGRFFHYGENIDMVML